MGDDDEVQPRQVDTERPRVLGEQLGVVPGVEEDALAAVLDERGEAPVEPNIVVLGEGVGDDGDAGIVLSEQDGWPRYEQRREQDSQVALAPRNAPSDTPPPSEKPSRSSLPMIRAPRRR